VANPPPKTKQPSTIDTLPFEDIRDGILFLKGGTIRGIVEVNAINFELRSGEEQEAIIQQFEGFLNSLDFPVQIVIQSRKFEIATYIQNVTTASEQLTNELLKIQAAEYIKFIQELSDLSNIMAKHFYVVLSFQATTEKDEKGGGFLSGITGMFAKKPANAPTGPSEAALEAYKIQLRQRADLVIGGLSGMGLKGHMLEQGEVVDLFKGVFNPLVPANQKT
jgi:hypothetical protein